MVRAAVCARVAAPATFFASLALRVGALRAGMSEQTLRESLLSNGLWQAGYDRDSSMCYWGPRGDLGDFGNPASDVLYECAGRLLTDTGLNKVFRDNVIKKRRGWDLSNASRLIKVGKDFFLYHSEDGGLLQTSIKTQGGKPVYGFHYSVTASNRSNTTLHPNTHYTLHLNQSGTDRSWYKVRCENQTWIYNEGVATCSKESASLKPCGTVDGGENNCMPEPVRKCLDLFGSTFGTDLQKLENNCMRPRRRH